MLSVRDKAEQWLQDNWGGPWSDGTIKNLEVLLKQQDRDTRHACAEAIYSLEDEVSIDGNRSVVDVEKAHSACMNVQAV